MNDSSQEKTSLKELATLFLKLGTIAFGGPAAHVAMMEDEVVKKRQWLTHTEFLDMLSATNFIPGPNSTEMAIHIGYKRAGMKGLIVAGSLFVLPAATLVTLIACAYVQYGSLPQVQTILYGIKPVIIAVVAQAIYSLARSAIQSKMLLLIGVLALIANLLGVNELLVIALAGLCSYVASRSRDDEKLFSVSFSPVAVTTTALASTVAFSQTKLFLFFLKVGSVLFGSGYVLIAFLRGDLVERFHWLTENQLLDAIAVGQFTPGPVFTTATFIGYVLGGLKGAGLATLGIFLPAFFFVALSAPYIPKLRRSKSFSSVLDGVNVASLAVMVSAAAYLAKGTFVDFFSVVIALTSFVLLWRFKVNSAYLVILGGVLGFLLA